MIPKVEISKDHLLTRYIGHVCGYGAHDDERGAEARAHLKAVLMALPTNAALGQQLMADYIHKTDPEDKVQFEWDWAQS